jgi:spore coat protein A
LLPQTAVTPTLTIMPGERYDAVLDFTGLTPGTLVTLKNLGPDGPYMANPMATPADPNTTGQVMQFRIGTLTPGGAPAGVIPANPRSITRLDPATAAGTRVIRMTEEADMYGRLEIMLNQTPFDAAPTEIVQLNDTEVWNFMNMTPDVHPMHLHDVMFQIVGRQALAVDALGNYLPSVDPAAPFIAPGLEEMGWKDTFQTWPGYENQIVALFADYVGDYVYHCHILEHEEFDMMRPFQVVPEPATLGLLALGGLALLRRRRA